jgi:hypothetical protein
VPKPDAEFKGKIGYTFADSQQDFPQPISAPKGAPNIVLILLDDVGFGQPGTFGGPIPTPSLDKLASQGLRYNRFHTTGICSPTRAALLTGRNHHQVATGTITELSTGFPGYHSVWPQAGCSWETGTARPLGANGITHPTGKPHLLDHFNIGHLVWGLNTGTDFMAVKQVNGNRSFSETKLPLNRAEPPGGNII